MRVLLQLQSKFRVAGFVALLTAFSTLNAQDAKLGKEIFDANCASCHGIHNRGAGPALKDVHTRRSEEWLLKWVKNNEALRKSGDAQALQVFNDNGGAIMPAFGSLSDGDIKNIIAYVKEESAKAPKKAAAPVSGMDKQAETPPSTLYVLLALIGLFLVVFLLLARVKRDLDRLAAAGSGE